MVSIDDNIVRGRFDIAICLNIRAAVNRLILIEIVVEVEVGIALCLQESSNTEGNVCNIAEKAVSMGNCKQHIGANGTLYEYG